MQSTLSLDGITLHVADVDRSVAFYRQLPGVIVLVHRPGNFALLEVGKMRLGLLKHSTGQFHIEFETGDLNVLYQELKDSGFPVQAPPSQKSWGEHDFIVTDPDGYMLEFGDAQHDGPGTTSDWSQNPDAAIGWAEKPDAGE